MIATDCPSCVAGAGATGSPGERLLHLACALSRPGDCCKWCHRVHEKCCPHEGPCKLHCGGVCVYVPPQKSQIDAPQIDVRLDFIAVTVSQADSGPLAAVEGRSGADDPRES